MRAFAIKRNDGVYLASQFRGIATETDSLYAATTYNTIKGVKSARGYLRDSDAWTIVPVEIVITEVRG